MCEIGGLPGFADFPEGLGEVSGTAPDQDPDGARIGVIDNVNDPVRGFGVLSVADALVDWNLSAGERLT